jgi:hypothetical protein
MASTVQPCSKGKVNIATINVLVFIILSSRIQRLVGCALLCSSNCVMASHKKPHMEAMRGCFV